MARQIKIDQIAGLMKEEIQHVVEATALSWTKQVKEETPEDTGTLKNAWELKIGKLEAEITNRMEYAEPVIYGNNLPPSWGGNTEHEKARRPGFPERIAKNCYKGSA